MGKIQDLYENRVKPMVPAERLQLARLILDDLAPSSESALDVSDEWNDDDLADVAAFSVHQATQRPDDSGSLLEQPPEAVFGSLREARAGDVMTLEEVRRELRTRHRA